MTDENVQSQATPEPEPVSEPAAQPETATGVDQNAKTMAMLCHLLGLVGFLGPLIIWLLKKDEDEFIDDQGKEAMNWQISVIIYYVAAWLLMFVFIGILLMPAVIICHVIFVIMGTVKANDGVKYRYPLAIKFIK